MVKGEDTFELPLERVVLRAVYEALLANSRPVAFRDIDVLAEDELGSLRLDDLPQAAAAYMRLRRLTLPDHQTQQLLRCADRNAWVRVRYDHTTSAKCEKHIKVTRVRPPVVFEPADKDLTADETGVHNLFRAENADLPSVQTLRIAVEAGELVPWVFPKESTEEHRASYLEAYIQGTWANVPELQGWENRLDEFVQFRYCDFSDNSPPSVKKGSQPVLAAATHMYSVDLRAIRFKHAMVIDGGDEGEKKRPYSIYDNIKAVAADPTFYARMMQNPNSGKFEAILPLSLFVLDNKLYGHDHKRVVACLAADQLFLPANICQQQQQISTRLSTYQWFKGIFSQNDKSMLMTIPGKPYFWIVGPDSDLVLDTPNRCPPLNMASPIKLALQAGMYFDVLCHQTTDAAVIDNIREVYDLYHTLEISPLIRSSEIIEALQKKKSNPTLEELKLSRMRSSLERLQASQAAVAQATTIEDLLDLEVTHMGNSLWYLAKLPFMQPKLDQLLARYPSLARHVETAHPPQLGLLRGANNGKTPYPYLEQLVLCLRTANYCKLYTGDEEQAKQTYTLEELRDFQRRVIAGNGTIKGTDGKSRPYHYLGKLLAFYFEGTDEGLLTQPVLDQILALQNYDHRRIFCKEIDGVKHYGCYQGLLESSRYDHLLPVPATFRYSLHLTKPASLARKILNRLPTGRGLPEQQGMLLPLGRYLHSLGYATFTEDKRRMRLDKAHWPTVARLSRRFADRVAIGVDVERIRAHYHLTPETEPEYFGLNEVGTLIFLQAVPNSALMGLNPLNNLVEYAQEGITLQEFSISDVFK